MTARSRSRGILDTSTVILLPRLSNPDVLPAEPYITAITLAELSVGPLVARADSERAARQAQLQQAESDFDPIPFDAAAARAFGQVAASLRRSGPKTAARAYDAMIAATALATGLPVYTCNPDDFAGIDGLAVVVVPHPGCVSASLNCSATYLRPGLSDADLMVQDHQSGTIQLP